VSRRLFLRGAILAGAGAALGPTVRATQARADDTSPPAFPVGIDVSRQRYENWSREIVIDDLWTCTPRSASDVVRLANWAHRAGFRLRARGKMHSWSPLTVRTMAAARDRVVLVDTTRHLTDIRVDAQRSLVRAQTGATMEALLGSLEEHGLGFTAVPATGGITLGGVLAVDGHGTGVGALGERRAPGHTYGTLSNLVLSLTAVVWSASAGGYELRTYDRDDPRCAAFLTHLGRAFVTSVTLRVGANPMLRCESLTDVPASELFAPTGGPRSMAAYLERAGRVEAIWYPFTDEPWVKVWSVRPTKAPSSRKVNEPYNYPFSDNIPVEVAATADEIVTGRPDLAPTFGRMMLAVTRAGTATSSDIWGPSKNVLLYIKPSTLRVHEQGYAVLTRRSDVQRTVAAVASTYASLMQAYEAQGRYPINMPLEIRASGVDRSTDVRMLGARSPTLSAATPLRAHPEWDAVVWVSLLTFPGTPDANRFFARFESWLRSTYDGRRGGLARPEWSKGWGYGPAGPWTNDTVLGAIPRAFDDWAEAVRTLDDADPHGVFKSDLLERLIR
jgi:FAD/FMN-containing dehydrogenase